MTWQRVDENTYIDDTLVTCAEYQLFINEMRKQGKYCQPDHWNSYQFQPGQAREPILGMRYSDTKAFCDWLTQHENGQWKYRLPSQREVSTCPTKLIEGRTLGCWIDGELRFAWLGYAPRNARRISHDFVFHRVLDRNDDKNLVIREAFGRAIDRAFDLDLTFHLTRSINSNYTSSLDAAIIRAKRSANAHERARSTNPERLFDAFEDHARAAELTRALARANELDRELELVLQGVRIRFTKLNTTSALTYASEIINNVDLDRNRNLVFEMYVDLYTLQERIVGHSPAFEGIRLVRERIK